MNVRKIIIFLIMILFISSFLPSINATKIDNNTDICNQKIIQTSDIEYEELTIDGNDFDSITGEWQHHGDGRSIEMSKDQGECYASYHFNIDMDSYKGSFKIGVEFKEWGALFISSGPSFLIKNKNTGKYINIWDGICGGIDHPVDNFRWYWKELTGDLNKYIDNGKIYFKIYAHPNVYTVLRSIGLSYDKTDYRALLMTVENYDDPKVTDLTTVRGDFNKVKEALLRSNTPWSLDLLIDDIKPATYNNVKNSLDSLKEKSGLNDITYISYNGHGGTKDTINSQREGDVDDEVLCLKDYTTQGDSGYMRDDEFADYLVEIKGYKIVILDCCKSNGFKDDIIESTPTIAMFMPSDYETQYGYYSPDFGHSFFTFSVISGLSINKYDDEITVNDFYNNLKKSYDSTCDIFFPGIDMSTYPDSISGELAKVVLINGFQNSVPDSLSISGPSEVKINHEARYTFKVEDDDNDYIDLYVFWETSYKKGHFEHFYSKRSGSEIESSFTWTSFNSNTGVSVLARDKYGAVSIWNTMDVKLEKSRGKGINNMHSIFFEKIFNQFPKLYQFLFI